MPHNTKLPFRSFKKGSKEEKLIQMEQFLKIISSKVAQISFIVLVIKPLFFTFRILKLIITQIYSCANISHCKLSDIHETLT